MTGDAGTKWTPGVWSAVFEKAWGWCVKSGKKYIAFRLPSEADAHLISAAPELYKALEAAMPVLEGTGLAIAARAALRQARGEKC